MTKKSNYILVVLFALSFLLGVGYAVVNSISLTITGSASAISEDLDVYFTSSTSGSNSKVTATATAGALTASIKVQDLTLNETVTATYNVENNETDVAALLSQESLTNSNTEHFTVSASIDNSGYVCTNKSKTTKVTITVKMIKTPVNDANSSANITLKLKADPKDASTVASTYCS